MFYGDEEDDGELREQVLGATAHLLANMGDQQASLLLEDVDQLCVEREFRGRMQPDPWGDPWSGRVSDGMVQALDDVYYLDVEPYLQARFTDEVLVRILPVLSQVAARMGLPSSDYLSTRPAIPSVDAKTWRETLDQRYAGDNTINQARKERLSSDSPVKDGLTFSNSYELTVYESLLRFQASTREERTIAIAPLPGVRIRPGNVWTPDFLIVGNGRAMILEVDGPHHGRPSRRANDDMRDHQFRRCGMPTRRVSVVYADPERVEELDAYVREIVIEGLGG